MAGCKLTQAKDLAVKKIMLTGLQPEVTEASVKASLEKFGPVIGVTICRDGDPGAPVVIVEMDISDMQAFQLTRLVTDIWHNGHMVNARLLLH